MAEETTATEQYLWTILDLPLASLAALGQAPDLACGGLSPLARLAAPDAPADAAGMAELLDDIEDMSPWAASALLDPQLTVGIIVGDEDRPSLRQYGWPDATGRGPGFEFAVADAALQMRGPTQIRELRAGMGALLNLYDLADRPALAMALSAAQFWALAAISDAYRAALGSRRLSRLSGTPLGVMVPDVFEAWQIGLETKNPGWAVSLFSLLVPGAVPESFEGSLRQTLEEMDDADLLMVLEGDVSAGPGATIVFSEGLELLAAGLSTPLFMFGLNVQRVRVPGEVEVTAMGGWRTPHTLWLVDLSGIADDEVQLVVANDELMTKMLDELLGGEPDKGFTMDTPYTADALRAKLTSAPAEAPARPRFCRHCRAETVPGARFCNSCGRDL